LRGRNLARTFAASNVTIVASANSSNKDLLVDDGQSDLVISSFETFGDLRQSQYFVKRSHILNCEMI
jgi:hypothetical protein